jgi:hypothetical protein
MGDLLSDFNHSRYDRRSADGFYESYFQRANHPTRPLAFWIRYTVFSPKGRPDDAIGELWAIVFDGEKKRHVVAKTEMPREHFEFRRDRMRASVGEAVLEPGRLHGAASSRGHRIEWDLRFGGGQEPLFLLDRRLYGWPFPKAKALVGAPLARYDGRLVIDGEPLEVDGWVGSQNHNWGAAHTDTYAYGQVAGFDNAPESFLEVGTARLNIGPFRTPFMTTLVLRHGGEEFALNTLAQALRAEGRFSYFEWSFLSRRDGVTIEGEVRAPKEAFVGLRYYNPPGGEKDCLNTKLATCHVTLRRDGRPDEVLECRQRAAFEILTDDTQHGVELAT